MHTVYTTPASQPTFSIVYQVGSCRVSTPYAVQAHAVMAAQAMATSHGAVCVYQHGTAYSQTPVMIVGN